MNKILGGLVLIGLVVGGYFWYQDYQKKQTSQTNQEQQQNNNAKQSDNNNNQGQTPVNPDTNQQTTAPETAVNPVATIETSEGTFKVTLDAKAAPKTVANFVKLSKDGFYNGTKFHRIMEGFMIQGGDPLSKDDSKAADWGTGGPGYTIPAEIGLKHTKGAIAMARQGDQVNPKRDSSGSQFYVTLAATPFLDGQYTVFGYVTSGMDVVEKIGLTPTDINPATGEQSVPVKNVIVKKITIQEK